MSSLMKESLSLWQLREANLSSWQSSLV